MQNPRTLHKTTDPAKGVTWNRFNKKNRSTTKRNQQMKNTSPPYETTDQAASVTPPQDTHTARAPGKRRVGQVFRDLVLAVTMLATTTAIAVEPVDLKTTNNFTILAGAGITSTGGGIIEGDVGASPIAGSAITIPPSQVNGIIYAVDDTGTQAPNVVVDPDLLTAAKGDLTTAYNDAAGRTPVPTGDFLDPNGGNIGGLDLVPGLYKFSSTASITGFDVTLTGGPQDVWIFQIASDLYVGSGIKVILAGGARARNIFWQVGTSAVLDTYSVFKGTILADQSVTIMTGSTLEGRALAFAAGITFDGVSGSLPQNIAPVAVADEYATTVNVTRAIAAPGVLANDSDADGDPISAVLVDNVTHGTLTLNADGSFSYTPALDYIGTDAFTYKANDGMEDSETVSVTLTVNAENTAPVAVEDAYAALVNVTRTVAAPGVLANDTDAEDDPLTAVLVENVTHGILALAADGSFSYAPALDYVGTDTFTYKANDGFLDSNVVTVTLTVNAENTAPVAVDDNYNVVMNTLRTVDAPGVLANDTDAEDDPLTAVLVDSTLYGALVLNADGSFTYLPDTDFTGSDSFTYRAHDGTLASEIATVNLNVDAANTRPVAYGQDLTVNQNKAKAIVLTAYDADGNVLTWTIVTFPTNGTLTGVAPEVTYTPDADYLGPDGFTFKVNDGQQDSFPATVTITVEKADVYYPPKDDDDYWYKFGSGWEHGKSGCAMATSGTPGSALPWLGMLLLAMGWILSRRLKKRHC